jgi:hypothetical protein
MLVSEGVEEATLCAAPSTPAVGSERPEDEPLEDPRPRPGPPSLLERLPTLPAVPLGLLGGWELDEEPPEVLGEELADERWPLVEERCLPAEEWWWPGWRGLPSTAAWPAYASSDETSALATAAAPRARHATVRSGPQSRIVIPLR